MNRKALFCDGTSSYVIPAEPEKIKKSCCGFERQRKTSQASSLLQREEKKYKWKKRLPVGYLIIMRQRGS